MTSKHAALLSLFFAAVACYSVAVPNELIYDDHEVIQNNPAPRDLGAVAQLFQERHFPNLPYYRPLTRTSLLLQKSFSGEDPAPFHLFNAALAGVAGMLAFSLLRLPQFGLGIWPAWAAAAAFALHPIASSCVYPVSSGRETMMPAVWTLAAIYCWLREGPRWQAGAVVSFGLALLSKEQAVIIPVLFVLADVLGLSKRQFTRYVPIVLVTAAYLAIRQALFSGTEYTIGDPLGPFWAVLYALQSIFVPFVELHYEPRLAVWLSWPRLAIALLLFAALLYGSRRTPKPYLFFWTGWFLLALLPTANILKQEAPFDERYVLLASLGIFALLAPLIPTRPLPIAAVLLVLAGISIHRSTYFADDLVFSRQWLRTDPQSVNAEYNLALGSAKRGDYATAVDHYRKATELRPDYTFAHNNLANALAQLGRIEEAIPAYQRAAQLDPTYYDAQFNLGSLLCQTGQFVRCIAVLKEVAHHWPNKLEVQVNLGNALAVQGDLAGAAAAFERALTLEPGSAEAHGNYGNVLARQGQFDQAIAHYREALRLNPNLIDAQRNLEQLLAYQRK